MRTLTLMLCLVCIVGCKSGGDSDTSESKAPKNPAIIDAPTDPVNPEVDTTYYEDLRGDVVDLESNFYVKDGNAHPTLYGDVIDVDGLNYKRAIWDDGDFLMEEGTMQFITVDVFDHELETVSSNYKIVFQPTRYNPSDCDYSFDSYERDYEWEANGPVITTYVDIGDDHLIQTFGWPTNVQPDYIEANLNPRCL